MSHTILFRAEASQEIGLGHLIRSLSIANKLRKLYPEVEIVFLSSKNNTSIEIINEHKFEISLQGDVAEEIFIYNSIVRFNARAIFIDKLYNYSVEFVKNIRSHLNVIMLHNYCEGAHYSNAYIFPLAHMDPALIKDKRWQNGLTQLYHGFDFVVLNERILNLKIDKRKNDKPNIIITTGGVDPAGVLLNLLSWLNMEKFPNYTITALEGQAFKDKTALDELNKTLRKHIQIVPFDPSLFLDADMAICNFGVSTYELLYLQIPILSIGHCEQNAKGSKILSSKCEQLVDIGNFESLKEDQFMLTFKHTVTKFSTQNTKNSFIDGKGVERVAKIIYKQSKFKSCTLK